MSRSILAVGFACAIAAIVAVGPWAHTEPAGKQATQPVAASPGQPVATSPGQPVAASPGQPVAASPGQPAREAPRLATVRDIRRTVLSDVVRVTIELDAEVAFHDERLDNPPRVFVDLSSTRASPGFIDRTLRFDADRSPVRQIRIGRHPNNTTRVVLDAQDTSTYSVYALYHPYRLVIDCAPIARTPTADSWPASTEAQPEAPTVPKAEDAPKPIVAKRIARRWMPVLPTISPRPLPHVTDRVDADAAPDGTSTGPPASAAPLTTASAAAASSPSGGLTIARQLGLGVARIVIDPGHGGHDPGAQGKGLNEAELVLDIAQRVEARLAKIPGIEVVLTRRTDEFVPLQERTAIANREAADLFLSIHANANESPLARGIETFFLNFASNLSAAAVAARENGASGHTMGALPDFVKAIALNNKLDESRELATMVQRAMVEKLRAANKSVRDLGVRQAPFVVLIGAAMPSVLSEISFVTNAQDARLLKSSSYRDRIADALFNAIRKYQGSLKGAPALARRPAQ